MLSNTEVNWSTKYKSETYKYNIKTIATIMIGGVTGDQYVQLGAALKNSRRRRDGGSGWSGGLLPKKVLKSRGSDMAFATFSMRYFSKNLNLDKV